MEELEIQQLGFFSKKIDSVRWKAFGRHLKCLPPRRTKSDQGGFVLIYVEFQLFADPNKAPPSGRGIYQRELTCANADYSRRCRY